MGPPNAALEGWQWRVTAINGQPTPANDNYRVEFKNGRIGGSVGCNHMGGAYALRGTLLTVSDLVSTEMACEEPAMSFEASGFRILGQPMQMTWASDRRLTLANAAGTLQLEHSP